MTISSLREALQSPDSHFRTLKDIKCISEIRRSTLFAECEIECEDGRYMLYAPLSSLSLRRAEKFIPTKRHTAVEFVPELKILRDEICYEDALGTLRRSDILLEPLRRGLPFAEEWATAASDAEYAATLLGSVSALHKALQEADLSHNNLKVENLLIDDHNRLYPIRWYYATNLSGGDDEALESMKSALEEFSQQQIVRDVEYAAYGATTTFEGHITVGQMSEGLVAVEDSEGWGFVDSNNRFVIRPQYLWVNDFSEGRAEVETSEGMGLINKQGEYIIPPQYDIVEYNPHKGESMVCIDGKWSVFDYFGQQLCPFGDVEPVI